MHPILSDRRRLALYLAGWLLVSALLAPGFGRGGQMTTAAAILAPLCIVLAFISLSLWYLCRTFPLGSPLGRTVAVHLAAGATASGIWIAVGDAWSTALDAVAPDLHAGRLFADRRVLLFIIGALLLWLPVILQYLLMAFEASQAAERRALELTLLTREAELKALRAQIDPHFLFNSLHSISALTASDPAGARRMCLLLADFLRDTLRLASSSRIALADELALADRFLEIERVRLGPRLQVVRETDDGAGACLVPPLLLQPLVENAVVHGIGHLLEGGTIRISAHLGGSTLTVTLENPCEPDRPKRRGGGLGLTLLRKRVENQFGAQGGVDIDEQPGRFRVDVRIPAVEAAA